MKTKVLLALMSFNIGGAETHVIELARELARRDYEPIIVSSGGDYVEEVQRLNIRHINIILNTKNPITMWKSYMQLKNLIIKEDIKLVHAHARIPGFILGILQKKLKFNYVTTVHGSFSTAFLYRLLSNWGQASVVVSQDLKEYLVSNYKVNTDSIFSTVNGICTDTFSPDVVTDSIIEEFDFDRNNKHIVYVCRLDANKNKSIVANKLIEIASELSDHYPDTRIIIIGDGDDYVNIKEKAEKVNQQIGTQYVVMTGARLDINKFDALAHIFVGVSRAALEAMATATPTILAGEEGYIGVFSRDKLDSAVRSNFTCRGEDMVDSRVLYNDLSTLLRETNNYLNELGQYGREIVKKQYSVERMTDDTIKAYDYVKGSAFND